MSNQPPNAWQTAGRPRHSHSASRTPQNRSGTTSPSQQAQPTQPPRPEGGRPAQVNNVWASRSSSAGGSNGASRAAGTGPTAEDQHISLNGFNAAEVRSFLSREREGQTYKLPEGSSGGRAGNGAAWGSKPNHMANNQPFFVQFAKQIATMEGGG